MAKKSPVDLEGVEDILTAGLPHFRTPEGKRRLEAIRKEKAEIRAAKAAASKAEKERKRNEPRHPPSYVVATTPEGEPITVGDLLRQERALKKTRERDVEDYLVKRVIELGGVTYKTTFIAQVGCPDRIVMWPDKPAVWVEVKAFGCVPRPSQMKMHKRMRDFGQIVKVVDSFDAVDEALT